MSVLTYVLDNIGSSCSRSHSLSEAETAENAKTLTGEFCKRQKQSNTSTSSYFLVRENQGSLRYLNRLSSFSKLALMRQNLGATHQLSMQTSIRQLKYYMKEQKNSHKWNQIPQSMLYPQITRLDYPLLNKELVLDVKRLWQDPAIQETYLRGSILQLPDCAQYFMENLDRLAEADYVPTKELSANKLSDGGSSISRLATRGNAPRSSY
ncbi:guanine nucleotide-binding protein alpha-1 subunit isoform X1 [Oryza sativa Japonica Group]|uniref:guanine nucleotide-binding protein alpha-1 subunit isoform X1 n=1 Tax=Oryza sativa subsp. japonica TaxID=39947 RepID=UPI000775396B|nr:guanine nucleotide-binding protein alpha-1 subunit [Oryza sativa Japonica Group]